MAPEEGSSAGHGETAVVRCSTTKGPIVMEFYRDWAPLGYDRAVDLFEKGYYDQSHIFRVIPNFLVQFGISYNADIKHQNTIPDDPQRDPPISFDLGIISFAGYGPNSRTSQLFIAYGPSKSLGRELWETPLGRLKEGVEVAKSWYSYGDGGERGPGPDQGRIWNGPQYIQNNFPLTDSFETCQVERRAHGAVVEPSKSQQNLDSTEHSEKKHGATIKGAGAVPGGLPNAPGGLLAEERRGIPLPRMPMAGLFLLLLVAIIFYLLRPSGKTERKRS